MSKEGVLLLCNLKYLNYELYKEKQQFILILYLSDSREIRTFSNFISLVLLATNIFYKKNHKNKVFPL